MNIHSIMREDPNGSELVDFAEQKAIQMVKSGLTRSQIRSIFTEVRRIESLWENDARKGDALRRLNMLKPKLDYQTSREEKVRDLRNVLIEAINEVNSAKEGEEQDRCFKRFVDLFEAILAYHRAKGGKK